MADRKGRERSEREHRIIAAARLIAANEGWSAVTIRRLAEAIEYSQPVLYSHFENRDAIVAAVAVDGFRELADRLRQAAGQSPDREAAMRRVGAMYLAFAREHAALYEAMFAMPIGLSFAQADTPSELKAAFAELRSVVSPSKGDDEVATETFWAALHGMAELQRAGRIRPGHQDERISLIASGLL